MSTQTSRQQQSPDAAPSKPDEVKARGQSPDERPPNPGPSRQESIAYGIVGDGLQQVVRRVPADEPPPLPENAKLKVIGKPLSRFDALQKVTGEARYTFDVRLPGMLYARRVVSTVPCARVTAIDTSAAEQAPGVRAVYVLDRQLQTAQLRDGGSEAKVRYPVVRYLGQPLAAVAAESQRSADEAAKLVKVTYEPLPHVTDLEEAMKDGAPTVFSGPTE